MTPNKSLTGGCLCGKIRYSLAASAQPVYSVICHCINCKKSSGTHMVNASIFLKSHFTLDSDITLKAYEDACTDSGTPVYRHFCGDCGSPVYITTPLVEDIVSIFSGTLDEAGGWWRPNKEQYIETKSHWLPDLAVVKKDGVPERHPRGPLGEQSFEAK
ncbi:Mss4-like protein [Macrophomina phaseolina]|uniref:Mss4-like protein n=1 Tax=Macrophomina phaseolina TaxID=35725 RepID=A0ABQ8G9X1_9PEZI|nr:Mss4-like protein [Macrophomina phaseolina]